MSLNISVYLHARSLAQPDTLQKTQLCSVVHFFTSTIQRHIYTAVLFTWTDYKTIMLPVITFGCATAPLHSVSNLIHGIVWIWIHLFLCNVSNQARSEVEDALNRPWRPLPSQRLTRRQATILRHITVALSLLCSFIYGRTLVIITAGLIMVTWLHDDIGLANTAVGKSLSNVGGYTLFEVGATKIMGYSGQLDQTSITAVIISGVLILTTIQVQDFADVPGDTAAGRVTIPMYAPRLSRAFTSLVLVVWSFWLGWYWGIGRPSWTIFVALGLIVGVRFFVWRSPEEDRKSYLMFNVWLICAHLLPLHVRWNGRYIV